jgi:hypothetical protein
MLVDNHKNSFHSKTDNHSYPKNRLLYKTIESIKSTVDCFLMALQNVNRENFNEDELTHIFVAQNDIQIRNLGLSIRVGEQYRDLFHKTKGIPDVYYSFLEEGAINEPLFIMEAKRLPTPGQGREKEYVIGRTQAGNPNGGIERFKLERHGKGLNECGMLAYVENNSFDEWEQDINSWITSQAHPWSEEEKLKIVFKEGHTAYLDSISIRETGILKLHHFWIDIRVK